MTAALIAAVAGLLLGLLEQHLLSRRTAEPARPRSHTWRRLLLPTALAAYSATVTLTHPGPALPVLLTLGAAAGPLAWIDQDEHRLPNRILGPWALAILALTVAAWLTGAGGLLGGVLAGGAIAFLMYLGMYVGTRGRIGEGDVKLAACLGATAAAAGVMAWFTAMLLGLLLLMAQMVAHRATGRPGAFPWGPALLLGALAGVLAA